MGFVYTDVGFVYTDVGFVYTDVVYELLEACIHRLGSEGGEFVRFRG